MKTLVYEVNLTEGERTHEAVYTLPVKKALIAYLQQRQGNHNTWQYPEDMDGIRKSIKPRTLFYPINHEIVVYATEQ